MKIFKFMSKLDLKVTLKILSRYPDGGKKKLQRYDVVGRCQRKKYSFKRRHNHLDWAFNLNLLYLCLTSLSYVRVTFERSKTYLNLEN